MWFWSKPIWRSRVFWFNLLSHAAVIAGLLSGWLPAKYAAIASAIQGTINIWLRLLTVERVSLTGD